MSNDKINITNRGDDGKKKGDLGKNTDKKINVNQPKDKPKLVENPFKKANKTKNDKIAETAKKPNKLGKKVDKKINVNTSKDKSELVENPFKKAASSETAQNIKDSRIAKRAQQIAKSNAKRAAKRSPLGQLFRKGKQKGYKVKAIEKKAKNFDPKKKAKFLVDKKVKRAKNNNPITKAFKKAKRFNPMKLGKAKLKKEVNKNAFVKAKKGLEAKAGMKLLDEKKLLSKVKLTPDQLKGSAKKGTAIPQSKNLALIQERKKQKEFVKKGVKKSVKYSAILLVVVVGIAAAFFLRPKNEAGVAAAEKEKPLKFGVEFKDFDSDTKVLLKEQTLLATLEDLDVSQRDLMSIERSVIENDGFHSLDKGKKIFTLRSKDDGSLLHFIYEHSPNQFMKLNLDDVQKVEMVTEASEIKVQEAGFLVQKSLMETILEKGLRYDLIEKIESMMASKIDLFRVKAGDEFKLIYEEERVNDEVVGTGNLLAISYKSISGKTVKGYYFDGQEYPYYDETGRPMKSSFLLAPVSIAKITSAFGPRFHPILKKSKPHNGTDYAAPEGTPIFSVADGEVIAAEFGKFNGNYVKIKHNSTYKSQYLHMSKIGDGIIPGSKVKQGQVIGYVGSTGLSTGPHVCFRFWKNDVQINHLTENLPQLQQLPFEEMMKFDELKEALNEVIDNTVVY